MGIKIALAGNPNCGKTTLFNALTGSNQFVGNWPGVTVEKKEGRLKKYDDVIITDLPGIYSLSPYTPEEVAARNYLINERPDVILNIIDGTNLERNLYLTTQLIELGIPVVIALNMMDIVRKNGDEIYCERLSAELGCKIVEISALKGTGIDEAAKEAVEAAKSPISTNWHMFSDSVEQALAQIDNAALGNLPDELRRWYAVKLFERDNKACERLSLEGAAATQIEEIISSVEAELEDDSESIITNERYLYISSVIGGCQKKKSGGKMSVSDKIDRVVTNRLLGLPIFAVIMFLVYYISMVTVGTAATDWANDGLFGDGWHLFAIGSAQYEQAAEKYGDTDEIIAAFVEQYGDDDIAAAIDVEADDFDENSAKSALMKLTAAVPENAQVTYRLEDEETLETTEISGVTKADFSAAVEMYLDTEYKSEYGAPDTAEYGVWVPGIPALIERLLDNIGAADWLCGLIIDGIVAGVGAVLGFVPQMLVLFLLLAFLEACGYMARIAFVLDRVFRKFGLSGKSFIPMLIGTGCGIPGIMASRTIENERDRRMTIITTTFIPCGAKVPFIAMIAGAIFGGSALVATSAYFIGTAAVILSGIILKKTRMFAGEPAPFVMEMPSYHLPTVSNLLRSTWERGWSFIKKAGTIILLSTVLVWFATYFGFVDGTFRMLSEDELQFSILAYIGGAVAWIFKPLGFGTWQAAVASVTGLIAKENIVGTMGVLYGSSGSVYAALAQVFNGVSGYAFLVFNLLCAPCFAAIGAIRREMNSAKWTWFAVGYQCAFAYAVALMINQFGGLICGNADIIGLIFATAVLLFGVYMLVRRDKYRKTDNKLT